MLRDGLVGGADELVELARRHQDPELWLLAGTAFIGEAWAIRGGGRAKHVGEDRFKMFFATLRKAVGPLHQAAELLPADAVPWAQLLPVGMGLQVDRDQKDEVWREVITRCPTLFPAHWHRLQILAAKWGGSHEEMLSFARATAELAPVGDPVTAMLALAHFEVFLDRHTEALERRDAHEMVRVKWRYFAEVRPELQAAADRWMANPAPHPRTLEAHNLFGAAFALAEDAVRARTHLTGMRDHVHDIPWGYLAVLAEDIEKEYQTLAGPYLGDVPLNPLGVHGRWI